MSKIRPFSRLSSLSSFSRTFASTHTVTLPLPPHLEVERKFRATPSAISHLRTRGSQFKSHKPLVTKTTHDIYYDQPNGLLFSKGIYIRRRNGNWEAKIRASGDYINSSFTEVDGVVEVEKLIGYHLGIATGGRGIEEVLGVCADFVCERESWMVDGRFRVDVDTVDFGHVVGEVELTCELDNNGGTHAEGQGQEEKARLLRETMDRDIRAFMESYPLAFPAGRPLGKLSAYFLWREKNKG